MPNREVIDLSYGSGNPAGTGIPFIPGPRKEPYTEEYIDGAATPAAYAAVGQIVVEDFTTYGSASWKKSAVVNQAVPPFSCGAVIKPAAANAGANTYPPNASSVPNQTQGTAVVNGPALALATSTANANKAINVGDPLCLDGAGNLTSAPATPATGTVVAVAQQALAGATGTPTLIKVRMGGY